MAQVMCLTHKEDVGSGPQQPCQTCVLVLCLESSYEVAREPLLGSLALRSSLSSRVTKIACLKHWCQEDRGSPWHPPLVHMCTLGYVHTHTSLCTHIQVCCRSFFLNLLICILIGSFLFLLVLQNVCMHTTISHKEYTVDINTLEHFFVENY